MFSRNKNVVLYLVLLFFFAIDTAILGENWLKVFVFLALLTLPLIAADLKSYWDEAYAWLDDEFLTPYLA